MSSKANAGSKQILSATCHHQDAAMNPRVRIATARTPDGGEMVLYQHDRDFSIMINGQELMHNRQYESKLALARLGCAAPRSREEVPFGVRTEEGGAFTKPSKIVMEHYHAHGNS
jgi:hypothetical protein